MRTTPPMFIAAVLLTQAVTVSAEAGERMQRAQAWATRAGYFLVPTRVSKMSDGTVILTRYGRHRGQVTNIERVTSTPHRVEREQLKVSIVDGDDRDMVVRQTTHEDGTQLTVTRRSEESPTFEIGPGAFQPLSYRRAVARAVFESPVFKTAATAAAMGFATALDGQLMEKIASPGVPSLEALHQATVTAGKSGAAIGGLIGAAMSYGTRARSRTIEVIHHPEVVTRAWAETIER